MSNKAKSKRPQNQESNKTIDIGRDVNGSDIVIGNNNTIIDFQSPTDDLVPMVLEGECPIPSG